MSKRGAEVLEEALSLPPGERAELADRLLTSLDSSPGGRIDALWAAEAEDRLEAFERGEIKAVSPGDACDYQVRGDILLVVAVMHLHREPRTWKDRLPKDKE